MTIKILDLRLSCEYFFPASCNALEIRVGLTFHAPYSKMAAVLVSFVYLQISPCCLVNLKENIRYSGTSIGDRPNLFVKWRVLDIENLDITNLRGNNQNVRYIDRGHS